MSKCVALSNFYLFFKRIARMIRQPRGNALLVGVGGTGKQSLTRLAAHICSYKCFRIELTRGYNYDSFRENLKELYQMAGIDRENTVFLFTDTQVCYVFLLYLLQRYNISCVCVLSADCC